MERQPPDQPNELQLNMVPITLYAGLTRENGELEWGLELTPDPPPRSRAELNFPRRFGGRTVKICIDEKLEGVKFDEEPISVHEGEKCPPREKGVSTDQIIDVKVDEETRKVLTFRNKNSKKCVLTYRLNIVGAKDLDPRIINGGT